MPIEASQITGLYAGSTSIIRAYQGSNLIFGTAPASSNKVTTASVLVGKGLIPLNVTDALASVSNDTNDPYHLFDPNSGSRNRQDPDNSGNAVADRWSVGTFFGKKALRSERRANQIAYLRYGSLWLPGLYSEFGYRASVYIPSSFRTVNSSGDDINGKTMFGIICGSGAGYQPGSAWPASDGNHDQVTVVSQQGGCALGINFKYNDVGNEVLFTNYLHAVGGKGAGGIWQERAHKYSHLWAISGYQAYDGIQARDSTDPLPRDQWFTIEIYAKMDTTLSPPNGRFEVWIERSGVMTLEQWAYDLDLGGTIANRPALGLIRRANTETFPADPTADIGPLYSSTGGGWGLHGWFCRDMLGGGYTAANTPVNSSVYFVADWAGYGLSKRVLKGTDAETLAWQEDWKNGVLNRGTAASSNNNAWQAYQGYGSLATFALVDDQDFGVYEDGQPAKVGEVSFGVATAPYNLEDTGGYRAELAFLYGVNKNGIRFGTTTEQFVCVSFKFDSNDWHDFDVSGAWHLFWQVHSASPLPGTASWSYTLIGNPPGRSMYFKWKAGQTPASIGSIPVYGGADLPLDTVIDVMMQIKPRTSGGLVRVWHRFAPNTAWTFDGEATNAITAQWDGSNVDVGYIKVGMDRQGENGSAPLSNVARKYRTTVRVGSTMNGADPLVTS